MATEQPSNCPPESAAEESGASEASAPVSGIPGPVAEESAVSESEEPRDGGPGIVPRLAVNLEPYLIVFAASAVTLIIEIVAARILAPHIGVSVYTWTSVIGVILAGISIGNWLGGVFADRAASRTNLGLILLAGAATTLLILPLAQLAPGWVSGVTLLLRIVLLSAILFIAPALILGMVSPMIIKLTLRDLSVTGNVVGRIYAVSTAGAIVGVFITGFLLIQAFGSRETILYVAILTAVMAVVAGRLWRAPLKSAVSAVIVAGLAVFTWTQSPLESLCTEESNYFCIRVSEKELEDGETVRVLALDRLVHSYARPTDPTYLHYGYQRVFATIMEVVANEEPAFHSLFIGGGGYELPRYLDKVHPESTIEVIEIDPEVTVTALDYLGLRRSQRVVTYNEDARMSLPERPDDYYHVVVGDAFNDLSVPYHLTTLEFNEEVRRKLKDGGIYAVNIVDAPVPGTFLRAYVHTLSRTFDHLAVIPVSSDLDFDDRMTSIVLASDRPIRQDDLDAANARLDVEGLGRLYVGEELVEWMLRRETVLITDDFAPIDNYLAPLFLKKS